MGRELIRAGTSDELGAELDPGRCLPFDSETNPSNQALLLQVVLGRSELPTRSITEMRKRTIHAITIIKRVKGNS